MTTGGGRCIGAFVLCVAACSESPRDVPGNASSAPSRLTGDGVGSLRIGEAPAAVASRGGVLQDTTVLGAEGMPARVLTVVLEGDRVHAEVVDDRIRRITVDTPRFRTADSLGVGSPLRALLDLPGAKPLNGEGRVFVTSPRHCGLSFQLSVPDTGAHAGNWDLAALATLPAGTHVTRVLVVGCRTLD